MWQFSGVLQAGGGATRDILSMVIHGTGPPGPRGVASRLVNGARTIDILFMC